MNFDQFVSEYIAEDHDVEQLSVMVLEGCRAWYPLAAEAEKQKLQEVMEKAARAAADAHRFGRYGFFLYDQTGEEQYRTWIERNAEWLKNSPQSENGVFGCVEDSSRNISGSVMLRPDITTRRSMPRSSDSFWHWHRRSRRIWSRRDGIL